MTLARPRPVVEPIAPLPVGMICGHCWAPVTGGTRWHDGRPGVLWPCGHTAGYRYPAAPTRP